MQASGNSWWPNIDGLLYNYNNIMHRIDGNYAGNVDNL